MAQRLAPYHKRAWELGVHCISHAVAQTKSLAHHSDGLHIPVDESEETLSAQGHLLLLLVAHFGFLRVLSASWLQFGPEALGRETGVAGSAGEE